jgi:phosphate/sulfate permease
VNDHPIGLVVEDDLKRNRLTVFFRLLLAIPLAIVVAIWSIAAYVVVIVAWFAALITGRVPAGLHGFLARFLRATTHLNAYVLLLADPWPPFGGEAGTYPVDLRVEEPEKQSRLTVLFRWILAIPAFVLSYAFGIVNRLVAFLGWFACLVTGRMPQGMRDVSAWMLRYEMQTYGYAMLLTQRYPSFGGGPTA